MSANPADTLVFFGALLVGACLLTYPATGFTGIAAVIGVIYFGLALVNGAGKAEKRYSNHKNRQGGRGKKRG